MRMPPFLLSGRFPSAIVPQGVSWWIWVGRFVLLVPPAPPVLAVSSRRRAPWGCLVVGCLGPLKAALVPPWRRASGRLLPGSLLPGTLMPLKVLVAPSPPDYLLPDRPGPLKALAAPWRRSPPCCLL